MSIGFFRINFAPNDLFLIKKGQPYILKLFFVWNFEEYIQRYEKKRWNYAGYDEEDFEGRIRTLLKMGLEIKCITKKMNEKVDKLLNRRNSLTTSKVLYHKYLVPNLWSTFLRVLYNIIFIYRG